jgi:uncharacterized RDD family membrane protein YckC
MVSKSRDLMMSRAAAGLIDAAIAAALGGVAARLAGWALTSADVDQDLREPVERLVLLGAFCLYCVLTTAGRGQATWGQRWLGLIVLGAEGGRPGRGEAFARWLAYLATLLPLGAGLLLALGPDHRPFHDRLCAGTVTRRSNAPGAEVLDPGGARSHLDHVGGSLPRGADQGRDNADRFSDPVRDSSERAHPSQAAR